MGTLIRPPQEDASVHREVVARLDALDAKLDLVLAAMNSRSQEQERLLTVAELAERLGVSRSHVYDHADDYGVIRLGDGKRSRLRFPPDAVTARHPSNRSPAAESPLPTGDPGEARRCTNGTLAGWRPIHAPRGAPGAETDHAASPPIGTAWTRMPQVIEWTAQEQGAPRDAPTPGGPDHGGISSMITAHPMRGVA